jgi:hypothetical protein
MKTAVEWLEAYLKKFNHIQESLSLRKAFEQAKEMEKQQIIDAINFGDERGKITTYKSSEQYYNETFNN